MINVLNSYYLSLFKYLNIETNLGMEYEVSVIYVRKQRFQCGAGELFRNSLIVPDETLS